MKTLSELDAFSRIEYTQKFRDRRKSVRENRMSRELETLICYGYSFDLIDEDKKSKHGYEYSIASRLDYLVYNSLIKLRGDMEWWCYNTIENFDDWYGDSVDSNYYPKFFFKNKDDMVMCKLTFADRIADLNSRINQ